MQPTMMHNMLLVCVYMYDSFHDLHDYAFYDDNMNMLTHITMIIRAIITLITCV